MVAKVISGKNIRGALNYNEQKVMQGVAQCIGSNLFKKDVDQLNFHEKLNRFTDLNDRNLRTKTNTLHISLNFDMSEKLDVIELNRIASTYMSKIGFGDQPYLVYEHKDAAHPHMHIVTTLIQENGKRIPIHYLGKNQSEKARKEIELEFGLVVAATKKKDQGEFIHPLDIKKVVYGKSESRRSIVNVVRTVTRSYKYTSLPELNAVLLQFNVIADRGTEQSKMFAKKGLLYSIINEKGARIGIPVKASAISGKPTLTFLEKQFKVNELLRIPMKEKVRNTIDKVLQSNSVVTKEQFKNALEKSGIAALFRNNLEGRTYGVTFVDNNARVVFNGSDLGKPYSVNAILEKLSAKEGKVQAQRPAFGSKHIIPTTHQFDAIAKDVGEMMYDLIAANNFDHASPDAALRLNKKRKKRRRK